MTASVILRSSLLTAALVSFAPARAAIAFSNLDPAPYRYGSFFGYIVGSAVPFGGPEGIRIGTRFQASLGGTLTGIDLALANYDPGVAAFTLRLYEDRGNALGSLLGTYSGTTYGQYVGSLDDLSTVSATGSNATLRQGARYWLVASSDATLLWSRANAATSTLYLDGEYADDLPSPAFAVQVNPVPEPASMAALGLGLAAFVRRRRGA